MPKPYILCVDDEPTVLMSLKAQLRRIFESKYAYETAESAEEAWELIEELSEGGDTILIIVSDWLMPKTKGDEFLVQVHKKYPNIIKIMLTGQADLRAVERAKSEANMVACLPKPWTEEALVGAINDGFLQQE